ATSATSATSATLATSATSSTSSTSATSSSTITTSSPKSCSQSKVMREVRREVRKYREFLKIVGRNHTDTLDYHAMTEAAINGALNLCDPHSQYLPKMGSEALSREIEGAPIESAYMVNDETLCIRVRRFSRRTAGMILYKYREFGSPPSLVLDFRGNKGGLVYEARSTAALFLDGGSVVMTRMGRTLPTRSYKALEDGELRGVELIVLIDGESASATEIVAGALKDHGKGVIVGGRSFGKALILKEFKLKDESSVLIAIAHYVTPDFRKIQRNYNGRSSEKGSGGVVPNIELNMGEVVDNEMLNVILRKKDAK
ncbi:MAG: S41 family peptidase, partial [Rikenellaceae bacterium]